jgi:hypothetical protein
MQSEPTAALKKLYQAVLVLASEEGKIEERLGLAYRDHLRSIPLSSLPPQAQSEWESITVELDSMYSGKTGERTVDATRAVDLAQRILLVYDSMIR